MTVLVGALCFFLGFLTAAWVFHCDAEKRARQRREKRTAGARPAEAPPLPRTRPSAEPEPRKTPPTPPERKPPVQTPPESHPQEQRPDGGAIPPEELLAAFEAAERLKLNFSYLAPDDGSSCFVQGEGYVRNARNEVIPDREAFRHINTCMSYAKSGLFWVFDISYQGRTYTFRQILDGEAGSGYVRLCEVRRPATVQKQAGLSCYTLLRKGQLEVADP